MLFFFSVMYTSKKNGHHAAQFEKKNNYLVSKKMDIPPHLADTTTLLKNHSAYSHFQSALIRCLLGLYVLLKYNGRLWERLVLTSLFGILLVFFTYKYMTLKKTWKVYARVMLTLSLSLLLLWIARKETVQVVVGTLFFVDAMMGIQSRHTATLL